MKTWINFHNSTDDSWITKFNHLHCGWNLLLLVSEMIDVKISKVIDMTIFAYQSQNDVSTTIFEDTF